MATRSTDDVSASSSSTIKRGDATDDQASQVSQHNGKKRPPGDSNDKDQKKMCSKRPTSSETDALSTSPRQQPVLQRDVQGSVRGKLQNHSMSKYVVSYRTMKGLTTTNVSPMQQVESMIQGFVADCQSPKFHKFCESQDFHGRKLAETQYHYLVPAASLMKRFQDAICNFSPKEEFTVAVVFHGAPTENIPNILEQGLDSTRRKRGSDNYFATHPRVSSMFCGGGNEMLVFLVVVPLSWHPGNGSVLVVRDTNHQLPIGTMTFPYAGLAEESVPYRTLKATDVSPMQQVESLIQEFVADCQSPKFRKFCETHNGRRLTETQYHYEVPEPSLLKRFQDAVSKFSPKEEFTMAVVFHGTPKENIPNILAQGLDPTLRKRGSADFFATCPSISATYCRGGNEMLVFLVVVPLPGYSTRNRSKLVVRNTSHQLPIGTMTFRCQSEAPKSFEPESISIYEEKRPFWVAEVLSSTSLDLYDVDSLSRHFRNHLGSIDFRIYCEAHGLESAYLVSTTQHDPHPDLKRRFQSSVCSSSGDFTIALVFRGVRPTCVATVMKKGLTGLCTGDYFTKDPAASARYSHGGKCILAFLVMLLPATAEAFASDHFVVAPVEHQLPIGVVQFHSISSSAWELSCQLHMKVLQHESDVREGHAKNRIQELLALRDISLASETFETEKARLSSESRREIGMYAYRKFDTELVQRLFPGLENPTGESVDFLVENMSSKQEMERLGHRKREKLQESRLVGEAAQRRSEQHVVIE